MQEKKAALFLKYTGKKAKLFLNIQENQISIENLEINCIPK